MVEPQPHKTSAADGMPIDVCTKCGTLVLGEEWARALHEKFCPANKHTPEVP